MASGQRFPGMSAGMSSLSYSTPTRSTVSRATHSQVPVKDKARKIHDATASSASKIRARPYYENSKARNPPKKAAPKQTAHAPKDSHAATTTAGPSKSTRTSLTGLLIHSKIQSTPTSTASILAPSTPPKRSVPAPTTPTSTQRPLAPSTPPKKPVPAPITPTSTQSTVVSSTPRNDSTPVPTLLEDCQQCRVYEAQILEIQESNKRKVQHYESEIRNLREEIETMKTANTVNTEKRLSEARKNWVTENKKIQAEIETCMKKEREDYELEIKTLKKNNKTIREMKGDHSEEILLEARRNWEMEHKNIEKLKVDVEWLVNTHQESEKNSEAQRKEFAALREVVDRLESDRQKMGAIFSDNV